MTLPYRFSEGHLKILEVLFQQKALIVFSLQHQTMSSPISASLYSIFSKKWKEDCGNVGSSHLLNMMIKYVTFLIIGTLVKCINKMSWISLKDCHCFPQYCFLVSRGSLFQKICVCFIRHRGEAVNGFHVKSGTPSVHITHTRASNLQKSFDILCVDT